MTRANPTWRQWLKANGHDLAPCTGQDARALEAIAACWQLLACCDESSAQPVLRAVRELLHCMQPKLWPLARELIVFAMDWSDRDDLWERLGVP